MQLSSMVWRSHRFNFFLSVFYSINVGFVQWSLVWRNASFFDQPHPSRNFLTEAIELRYLVSFVCKVVDTIFKIFQHLFIWLHSIEATGLRCFFF